MSTSTRVGGFLLALAATFVVALGLGNLVGPINAAAEPAEHTDHESPDATSALPGGLMISERGYTLALERSSASPGAAVPVSFRILGPDGHAVTAYEVNHDKRLHLIAVRRDLTGFQHVHPALAADGVWSTPLSITPGTWRIFADFRPTGEATSLTLGADLLVPGDHQPVPLPPAVSTADVDGYTIALAGRLVAGEQSELTLTVRRNGAPVTDLEPYLSAYGHLVALRVGDLAYLHVHPLGEPGDGTTPPGPAIEFAVTAPSAGDYRLFLDFQHDGVVRTAAFTVHADGAHDGEHTP